MMRAIWHAIFGHIWTYGADEDARELLRANQKSVWLTGTFEARETRVCDHCGRSEQRDVYGGNYRPHGWTLRRYKATTQQSGGGGE